MANNHAMLISASLTSSSFSAYMSTATQVAIWQQHKFSDKPSSILVFLHVWLKLAKFVFQLLRYVPFIISLFILISVVYCVSGVWASNYPTNGNYIVILQKKIVRFISKNPFDAHHSFKEFHILKFPDPICFKSESFCRLSPWRIQRNVFKD